MVILTGLLGASIGQGIMNRLGVRDDVTQGLVIGSTAHGLGSAGKSKEP